MSFEASVFCIWYIADNVPGKAKGRGDFITTEYTMFGYDEGGAPVVATNLTAEQAKAFADVKGLADFFLSPQDPQAPSAGIVTYELSEDGKYRKVTLRQWVKNNLIQLRDE